MKRLLILILCANVTTVPAQEDPKVSKKRTSTQRSSATLDRMIATGKSPQELAQYVFDTHGCNTCHTIGYGGKLGYTEKGKQRADGFEGCVNMLTAMTVIVQVPEDKRSPQQREKATRFDEFGCTTCHKLTPGKLTLTEVGSKLAHLHLGCVDVEKLTSSRPDPKN
jgi:hypothetical protein